MDTSRESKGDTLGSNELLSEILGVLKRIDTHLEVHERGIRQLDLKISKLASGRATSHGYIDSDHERSYGQFIGEEPITRSPTNDGPHQVSPTTPRRDLTLYTAPRNLSSGSGHTRDSVSGKWSPETRKAINVRNKVPGSPKGRDNSIAKIGIESRTATWTSQSAPPSMAELGGDVNPFDNQDYLSYNNYPPPQNWVSRSQGRVLDVKYSTKEARDLWKTYLGDACTIPPDGRIELTSQKHILERLEKSQVMLLLKDLQNVSKRLEYRQESDLVKRGSFKVTDYDFDPNFEESIAEYGADIPTGQFRKQRVKRPLRQGSIDSTHSAPWKRIIEVKGLSRKLIDGHETWTSKFRDPWNEALPVVNSVFPFLTSRTLESSDNGHAGAWAMDEALLHHQQCWRRPPRFDHGLCFHITFYELVELSHEKDLEGEIWRSGRLHSDNEEELMNLFGVRYRRIRESACTIVAIADLDPAFSHRWTILYLCPNTFELYDKTENFEKYDTVATSIKGRDVNGAFTMMVDLSVRMVISRWDKIAEYFAWLVGHHRDILADPDAHDSLLFDDDSFSRSRRYFWAINYLAELDVSITGNIVELEKLAQNNHPLREQLSRLQYLRGRLRAQREDAIALRDGFQRKLFSASGVMESRASTRLGENVKLLTFSIWSVNSAFNLKALVIVAVLVGIGTYIIVFNLDIIVGFCNQTYSRQKSNLLEQMKNDPDKNWSERAKRFETFQPKYEKTKPSEWLIVSFVLHRLLGGLKLTRFFRPTTDHKEEHKSVRKLTTGAYILTGLTLDGEAIQANDAEQKSTTEAVETKRKSSTRGGFARLSTVFMFRRGAFSKTARSINV